MEDNCKEVVDIKYKEIVSSLPKGEATSPFELCKYQGFWLPLSRLKDALSFEENFKAKPSDIYLCTFPKTGTTWLKALTFSIITRHQFDESTNPLLTNFPHECVQTWSSDNTPPPFLDSEFPLVATHFPYTYLRRSALESDCKIIYLCREPKDTFVSIWNFLLRVKSESNDDRLKLDKHFTLENEAKKFIEGTSAFGPYWDHVIEYWKASIDRPQKVLFLKYEDLKNDTMCYVKKLAEFMGKPFSKEEEYGGVAEKIVKQCELKSLSNLEVNKSGFIKKPSGLRIKNNVYFRKGEVGDWKNILTDDIAKSIDHMTQEKFHSLGLVFLDSTQTQCKNNAED